MKMDHWVGVLFAAVRYHRPGLKCGYWFIALSAFLCSVVSKARRDWNEF